MLAVLQTEGRNDGDLLIFETVTLQTNQPPSNTLLQLCIIPLEFAHHQILTFSLNIKARIAAESSARKINKINMKNWKREDKKHRHSIKCVQ